MTAAHITDDDATLVARCRQGEAAAWGVLVKRYQRLVYAVVMRTGLDEHAAADVFQTVFSRLVDHLPRLAQPDRLQAWIVTTAKREALRARQMGQRTVSMTRSEDDDGQTTGLGLEDTLADDAPLAEEALSDLQQLDLLRLGLDRLDDRCRDLLTLLFRDEDDSVAYDDIARRLNMAVGSIGPTRSRCLAKLRQLVEGGL
jgi:RNA polymerase sigma factor (sigma-70 family)